MKRVQKCPALPIEFLTDGKKTNMLIGKNTSYVYFESFAAVEG